MLCYRLAMAMIVTAVPTVAFRNLRLPWSTSDMCRRRIYRSSYIQTYMVYLKMLFYVVLPI